jgi:hypothetical protein
MNLDQLGTLKNGIEIKGETIVEGELEKCPICLEEYVSTIDQNKVQSSRCGHSAHSECLHNLMRSGNYNCPVCRNPFGEVPSSADKSLTRYLKMLKSNLPPAAVRQRMKVDGVSPAAIDSFFTGGASLSVQTEDDKVALAATKVVDFEKYKKMLSVGMNDGAVQQRMLAAGISQEEIDKLLDDYLIGKLSS